MRFKSIVQEQVVIGYLSKGGVTYSDTERMSPYERKIVLDALKELLDKQNQEIQKHRGQSHHSQSDPKTGLTSGVRV